MAKEIVRPRTIALDEVNMGIIRHFRDGRVPFSKVAEDLGVSENTVRARVKGLRDSQIMEITGLIDPDALPGHSTAFVGLKVEPQQVMAVAEEVADLRGVVATAVVSGRYNLMTFMMYNEEFTLVNFMENELRKVRGILEVEVLSVIKGFHFNCRYLL